MLFTSITLTAAAKPSAIFKDAGNSRDQPASVSELSIIGLRDEQNELYNQFVLNLSGHVYATLIQKFCVSSAGYPFLSQAPFPSIIPPPRVGLRFDNHNDAALQEQLNGLGFSKETKGRVVYYRGTINEANAPVILSLGSMIDPYVPHGLTTIKGYAAYLATTRILEFAIKTLYTSAFTNGVKSAPSSYVLSEVITGTPQSKSGRFRFLGAPDERPPKEIEGGQNAVAAMKETRRDVEVHKIFAPVHNTVAYTEIDATGLFDSGIFLPYFDTLLTKDKPFVPNFIIRHFQPLLGTTPQARQNMAVVLKGGWLSLGQTTTGIMLSHIAYGLDLAMNSGLKPVIVRSQRSREYIGMVLFGEKATIIKDGFMHLPLAAEKLKEEVSKFDGHENALGSLAILLSEKTLNSGGKANLSVDDIATPRLIRNAIIQRNTNLDSAGRKGIKDLLNALKFVQEYWDPSVISDVVRAVKLISKLSDAPIDAPILLTSEAMFVHDNLLSVLAAFGQRCPALYDVMGDNTFPLGKRTEAKKLLHNLTMEVKARKPLRDAKDSKVSDKSKATSAPVFPNGLPVLVLPPVQAANSWRRLMKEGVLCYRRNNAGNLSGTPIMIREEKFEKVSGYLTAFARATVLSKKREREPDDDRTAKEAIISAKRMKKDTNDTAAMFSNLGLFSSSGPARQVLREDDDEMSEEGGEEVEENEMAF